MKNLIVDLNQKTTRILKEYEQGAPKLILQNELEMVMNLCNEIKKELEKGEK
jgi:hypothetical protein